MEISAELQRCRDAQTAHAVIQRAEAAEEALRALANANANRAA
jgi:hypothetical protein